MRMSAFFRKRRQHQHPTFGLMQRDRGGSWTAEVVFPPTETAVLVLQAGPEAGPEEWGGPLYDQLVQRYDDLAPRLGQAIFERYTSPEAVGDGPTPSSAQDLMRALVLEYVGLDGPEALSLGMGFQDGAGWDDATFTVVVRRWQVAEVWMDD
jgi:hypothetical protein